MKGLALLGVVGMTAHFARHGPGPEEGHFAAYPPEPPSDIGGALAGTLVDGRVGMREVVAALVNAARKGYLRIEEKSAGSPWGVKRSYQLTLLRPVDAELAPEEADAVRGLGFGRVGDTIDLSELEEQYHSTA